MTEQERFEHFLWNENFPLLPTWVDGKPPRSYLLERMWRTWQASRATPADQSVLTDVILAAMEKDENRGDTVYRCGYNQAIANVRPVAMDAFVERLANGSVDPDKIAGQARAILQAATRATPSADAVDAQRYRWLREQGGAVMQVFDEDGKERLVTMGNSSLDAEIDKAIAASAPKGDGND